MGTVCPDNGFVLGNFSCACNPGYYVQPGTTSCTFFVPARGSSDSDGYALSNVSVSYLFREYVTANRITAVQTWLLSATAVLAAIWLAFCFLMRKGNLKDGRSAWFRWRYWISRLDFVYAKDHWLEDQKAQVKRFTELGGAFSVAAWIFFLGLFSALLYEFAAERKVDNQNLRVASVEEVASFANDIEINITTVSSMSCAQLRGLDILRTGTPGSLGVRTSALHVFANATCSNTSLGPMVQLSCRRCQLDRDKYYIPWYFVDSPGRPASAVGFQFAILASPPSGTKRTSFVNGNLSAGSNRTDRTFGTLRGTEESILGFAFIPHVDEQEKWKLMEASFRQYVPGTVFTNRSTLQTSYENPGDGFVNVTVQFDVQSSFLLESSPPTSLTPATFLARLGGLYTISICFFYVLMREFEYRVRVLRFDDKILNKVHAREKARLRWSKIKLFVKYRALRDAHHEKLVGKVSRKQQNFQERLVKTLSKIGSSAKKAKDLQSTHAPNTVISGMNEDKVDLFKDDQSNRQRKTESPKVGTVDKEVPPGVGISEDDTYLSREEDVDRDRNPVLEPRSSSATRKAEGVVIQYRPPTWALIKQPLPPVPELDFGEDEDAVNQMDVGVLQEKLRQLHGWNTRLRADLLNTQRVLDEVTRLFRPYKDF